jgi:8-oxoguanine deaminase
MHLALKNIGYLVTMNPRREILRDAYVEIHNEWISRIGCGEPSPFCDEIIDAKGGVAVPGLINTHHHMFQNLARAYAPISNQPLLPWLKGHLPLWKSFTAEDLALATEVAMAELMLSGCTTTSDHHYLFPRNSGISIESQFEVAARLGMRFHSCRGCLDIESEIVPSWLTEKMDEIIEDISELAERWHDPGPGSMRQVSPAPCTVFSASSDLLRETAVLARVKNLRMHIHCGETPEENALALKELGRRPFDFLEALDWTADRVWFAHGIHFTDDEVKRIHSNRVGIAHCPTSNMRLGSGICRVKDLRQGGTAVSLGVDGSASNDSSDMLNEIRQALLLTRVLHGAGAMTVEEALEMATLDGARNLGRATELGSIEERKCADLAIFPASDLASSGAHDKVHALVLCLPRNVQTLVVNGRICVRDGNLIGVDLPVLQERHAAAAKRLANL